MPRGNFSSMFGALQNLPPSRFTPQLSPFQADVMAGLADVGLGGNMPIIPPTTPTMTAPMLPGGLGPLDFQTQEPVPPPLPQQPNLDEIRARYMAIAGPPPVAPTIHPASKLEQIAAILSGVSYGQRGQGAEYLAGLREQKEKPQREYQAKQDAYQNILRSLALTGEEAATRAQEGYQRTTQGLLNQRY